MPKAILTRDQVIDRLMTAFRRHGYAGASLAELSKATGLGKSSLYHYFPDGKDDMTRAVLDRLGRQLDEAIFTPLRGEGPARRRVEGMLAAVDAFYRGGREACLMGNLVIGETKERFHGELARLFGEWIDALAVALRDAGLPRATARARAADAVIRIEGALVLAGALNDVTPFTRTLAQLSKELLTAA